MISLLFSFFFFLFKRSSRLLASVSVSCENCIIVRVASAEVCVLNGENAIIRC
jgi:hypothetical protein